MNNNDDVGYQLLLAFLLVAVIADVIDEEVSMKLFLEKPVNSREKCQHHGKGCTKLYTSQQMELYKSKRVLSFNA